MRSAYTELVTREVVVSRRALLMGACALAWTTSAEAESVRRERTLFTLARSKNSNCVHYAVRLDQSGELDLATPLHAYWIMHAEDGRREELTFLERRLAYGFRIVSAVSQRGFGLRLAASAAREIRVERSSAQRFSASLRIAGQRARLQRIYVQADEGSVLPSVRYVDLFGIDSLNGATVFERMLP